MIKTPDTLFTSHSHQQNDIWLSWQQYLCSKFVLNSTLINRWNVKSLVCCKIILSDTNVVFAQDLEYREDLISFFRAVPHTNGEQTKIPRRILRVSRKLFLVLCTWMMFATRRRHPWHHEPLLTSPPSVIDVEEHAGWNLFNKIVTTVYSISTMLIWAIG